MSIGSKELAFLFEPDIRAAEIVQDLEAALEQFRTIAADLREGRKRNEGPHE